MESVNEFFDEMNSEIKDGVDKIKESVDLKFKEKKKEFLELIKTAEERHNKICKNQETCLNFEPIK